MICQSTRPIGCLSLRLGRARIGDPAARVARRGQHAAQIFTAAGLSSAGSIRLFTNPSAAGSVRLPCARHCAEATAEKSPASIAAVGMNVMMSAGVCVARVP